jgi:hypothetical protein
MALQGMGKSFNTEDAEECAEFAELNFEALYSGEDTEFNGNGCI